jgi:hypothetical protein
VDIMILMHFFLDREFYVILPYGWYDGSVICTEEWILEYISNWNLDASIVYKRSEVLDKENNPIIVNEDMQWFINGVEQQVVKLDKKKVSDNQVLNQFFKIIDRESRKNNWTIQIEAEISSSWKILWRLKSKSNNPSNYKKLEDELQGYGKISKNVHGWITTWLEVEKSIKIEPQDE